MQNEQTTGPGSATAFPKRKVKVKTVQSERRKTELDELYEEQHRQITKAIVGMAQDLAHALRGETRKKILEAIQRRDRIQAELEAANAEVQDTISEALLKGVPYK